MGREPEDRDARAHPREAVARGDGDGVGDSQRQLRVGELIRSPVTINKILVSRYFLDTSMFLVYEANGIIRSEANSFTLPVIKGGKLAGLLLSYDSKNQTALVLEAPSKRKA